MINIQEKGRKQLRNKEKKEKYTWKEIRRIFQSSQMETTGFQLFQGINTKGHVIKIILLTLLYNLIVVSEVAVKKTQKGFFDKLFVTLSASCGFS